MIEMTQIVNLNVRAAVCGAASTGREALLHPLRLPAIVSLVLLP